MSGRLERHDWSVTPLGPADRWPQSLKTTVDIVLGSRHPMFVAWGPSLTFIHNDAYLPLLGSRGDGALGRPFASIWADIWPDIEPLIATALGGGSTWSEDLPLTMHRNGYPEIAYFTFSYSPVRDERGAVGGMFCAVTETTDKVLARAALRDSEERFRNMADHAPVMVWVTDADGFCTYLNREWYRVTGQSENDAHGYGWLDAVHPDDRRTTTGIFVEANRAQRAFRSEYRLRWRDGVYRWAIDAAAPRHAADGTYLGYVGSVVDISEIKQAEEASMRVAADLAEADRRKDEFLAMLAHELRNPLAPLTNALRLLARTESLTEIGRSTLAMAERQRAQLARLVDDLLEVSRITRGRIDLRPESMALDAAVHAAIEARLPGLEERGQALSVALPSGPLHVNADPTRIAQILDNLLTNAKKFTPEGGSIRVELDAVGDWAEVRVIDSGVGIAPDALPKLFELFSQVDATLDRSQGGLGIGLALVKRLVELHGGTVGASSDGPGRGATFVVRLPLARAGA